MQNFFYLLDKFKYKSLSRLNYLLNNSNLNDEKKILLALFLLNDFKIRIK